MDRRRNRGNEMIVALVVVGTLAVALTFGIIVTLSSHADEPTDSDRTSTAVSWYARQTQRVITLEATSEEVAILSSPAGTDTPTQPAASDTATQKPSETATPEPAPTDRPVVAATEEPSETPTERPTEQPAATETPTEKPADQPTQRPTQPVPTLTPTERPTVTETPRPSNTPTERPTLTATPRPTNTNTPTRTPRPTQTFTPTATEIKATLTFTPYPTLTPSITPFGGERTNTPVPSGCTVPQGWISYTIQPGDTLFALSLRFKLPQATLAEANCLNNAANITAGQILFIPPGSNVTPSAPSGNVPAGNAPSGNYSSFDCGNPAATISSPVAGTVLRGTVAIFGTATHPDFQFYRLQVSGGGTGDGDFATLDVFNTQVSNGQLGTLNTAAFVPGDYWLRLTVVDNTGNYLPQCTVRVRFEP